MYAILGRACCMQFQDSGYACRLEPNNATQEFADLLLSTCSVALQDAQDAATMLQLRPRVRRPPPTMYC